MHRPGNRIQFQVSTELVCLLLFHFIYHSCLLRPFNFVFNPIKVERLHKKAIFSIFSNSILKKCNISISARVIFAHCRKCSTTISRVWLRCQQMTKLRQEFGKRENLAPACVSPERHTFKSQLRRLQAVEEVSANARLLIYGCRCNYALIARSLCSP